MANDIKWRMSDKAETIILNALRVHRAELERAIKVARDVRNDDAAAALYRQSSDVDTIIGDMQHGSSLEMERA